MCITYLCFNTLHICVYICVCGGSSRAQHWAHTAAGESCREVKSAGTENGCNAEHKLLLCCLLERCTVLSCWLYIWEQIIWPAVELEASRDTWWYPIRLVTAASPRSTRGTRAAGTECQDADEVLVLNECLLTNDPGLCYQVPWAVLPWESHLSGTCKISGAQWGFVFCFLLIRCQRWGVKDTQVPREQLQLGVWQGSWLHKRVFVFPVFRKTPGYLWVLHGVITVQQNGKSSLGEGAVHPTWVVVIFPLMVMMILFSLSGKICDASCNLKMFWFTVIVKPLWKCVILQNFVGNSEAGIKGKTQSLDNIK